MSDPFILRKLYSKELEAGRDAMPKPGPAPEFVELVPVPGKARPARVTFRLSARRNHRLIYSATCPRCHDGELVAETALGNLGRTQWPPATGFPTLCEACEEEPVPLIQRDDIWRKAKEQQREQLKEARKGVLS